MRFRTFLFAWLVGSPLAAEAVLFALTYVGPTPDTSRAAADRITRGMTVDEVSRILGGTPGDYRINPPQQPWKHVFGVRITRYRTHYVTWVTDAGRIDVVDGHSGYHGSPFETGNSWSDVNGVVRSIDWHAVEPGQPRTWLWASAGLLYVLVPVLLYRWWPAPAAPSAPRVPVVLEKEFVWPPEA